MPTFEVDGQLFRGFDALPMLRACLAGDPFFDGLWRAATRVAAGVRRQG